MMTAGVVSVPIYPTLPAQQIHYLLEHSESQRDLRFYRGAAREDPEHLGSTSPRWRAWSSSIPMTSDDERITALATLLGGKPLSEDEREDFEQAISAVQPQDLSSVIYTSGTTGTPKGVMLTHSNFGSNVRDNGLNVNQDDVALSFLPLSHVAERMADYAFFQDGATVAYAESIEAVPQNLLEVKPTVAVGVPRFFEKVHDKVQAAVAAAPAVRRGLFNWAIGTGKATAPYRLKNEPMPLGLRLQVRVGRPAGLREAQRTARRAHSLFHVGRGAPSVCTLLNFSTPSGSRSAKPMD